MSKLRVDQLSPTDDSVTINVADIPSLQSLRGDLADVNQGDALIGVKQPITGSVNRTQHTKNYDTVSVADFGVIGNGTADDTAAMQLALDSQLSLFIPAGMTVNVTEVYIRTTAVQLYGPGAFKGRIVVVRPQTGDPYQSIISLTRISGIKFLGVTTPIVLRRGRGILIDGNTFNDVTGACVRIAPTVADFDDANHCVEDVNISGNICSMVDRLLQIDCSAITTQLVTKWWLGNGDVHVTNNIVRVARVCHISADRVDGLTVNGNTFLHYGAGPEPVNKTRCIEVTTRGSQVMIMNNELFEPAQEAIYLNFCVHYNITGNNIIQAGQRAPSDGIRCNFDLSGGLQTLVADGVITNNTIYCTTRHAITLTNQSNVLVHGNNITLGTGSGYYFGTDPLPNFADRYGVYTEQAGTSSKVSIKNNLVVDATTRQFNAFSSVQLIDEGVVRYDDTTTSTTLNGNYQHINLNKPSAVTVTGVSGGYEGSKVALITFNGNTTLQNNANLSTGTGADRVLGGGAVFYLYKYGSTWYLK